MRTDSYQTVFLASVFAWALFGPTAAANWPQWRGPQQDGISTETGLPLELGEGPNLAWKRELPGWGTSTPIIWGDDLFITSQRGEELLLLRLERESGKTVWEKVVGHGGAARMELRLKSAEERRQQRFHDSHNLASPSPTTRGERVYVHFGNGDLAAFDFDGKELWKRNLQEEHGQYTIWWGHANSPVLHGNLVISVCMQDSLADLNGKTSDSYLVAHDQLTGKEVWKTLRNTGASSEPCDSYVTPVFHATPTGPELVVMGGTVLDAYDPSSGKRLWQLPGLGGNRVITGPTIAGDRVFTTVGMRGHLLAVKLEGNRGDRPPEDVVWRHTKGTPDTPCPVVTAGLVFIVSDNGIATALDAATGAPRWTERLEGDYRASPIAAEGRVYFTSQTGVTTVVAAAPELKKLARAALDDEVIASPAISGGRIFVRGKKQLYCFRRP